MNKKVKIILLSILGILFLVVMVWFAKKNAKSPIEYETEKPFKATIINKAVATGKVIPLEEVLVKPQIAGIIDKIYVEEGAKVNKNDLIATVRVVPNVQSLNSAIGRVETIKIQLKNSEVNYLRNKALFQKGVVSKSDFEKFELPYFQAQQDLKNAESDLDIVKKGSTTGLGQLANTNILATMTGTILEIPVKEGDQVIQSNSFNAGTTIASIADLSMMIFEGKVDEAEVGKLKKDTELTVTLGAIDKKEFKAKLNFIAPKGTEENGAVQFKIKADVKLDDNYFIRAGYSANASIILEQKDSVLSIKESLLKFDKKTEKPYIEVKVGDQKFERRDVELGISDGINVEVLKGISPKDEIKIWNKAKKDEKDNNNDN
ncbi:MAG: efflux transporter periplasmic adaptor subunit [Flavobacteriales bacterium CG_4_9_14_0_2_um_filter_35_242]|nr:efflux RND transporter periplasmic adaptor subunit [Zetaproteobacteria bacterium]OIO10313.1 MAG: efflux transporter periplasmic adaptor subunit [Flavobacteriaceae bacterium CG1_02_35_72]PIR14206.1 MAG: efflux transporter periplasmic adaptor subunit [Flavobacteriales bacterium CG11_big_fil_rev_8_21_14_0_20_35_7]PJA05198.1 MAG: efflux transporter periplasmic adaptor subunit [Flavobacteriales bacterium CG_4_10_14_0_2_um_filter_35_18]PJC60583.1 MAG: efflux transporter periplasmic adaptor subunit